MWEDEHSGETEERREARVLHWGSVGMVTVMEAGWGWGLYEQLLDL